MPRSYTNTLINGITRELVNTIIPSKLRGYYFGSSPVVWAKNKYLCIISVFLISYNYDKMKIFIICSKAFYGNIPPIKEVLDRAGHEITLPNCYDNPDTEARYKAMGDKEHAVWKSGMLRHSRQVIEETDAVLVLNFEKNGQDDYIGGATFLEMYDAFRLGKKIYMYNSVPDGILRDEIEGFEPILLHGNLGLLVG